MVGERVVKGLCSEACVNVGGVMRGNGYEGVLVVKLGVMPPRMVLPDSVDAVAGSEEEAGDMMDSSWMGETLAGPAMPPVVAGCCFERADSSLRSISRARRSRYSFSCLCASALSISTDILAPLPLRPSSRSALPSSLEIARSGKISSSPAKVSGLEPADRPNTVIPRLSLNATDFLARDCNAASAETSGGEPIPVPIPVLDRSVIGTRAIVAQASSGSYDFRLLLHWLESGVISSDSRRFDVSSDEEEGGGGG